MSMPLRPFGKTGLNVSPLGFGCMRLPTLEGGDPSKINRPLAIEMIRKAIDAGVNYVDTAWPYHTAKFPAGGESEPLVKEALQDGYRDKVYVATKLPLWCIEKPDDMDRYLDMQLERLGLGYLDVYLAHNLNTPMWEKSRANNLFAFLDRAVKDGRVRHPGFSFHDEYHLFEELMKSYDWQVVQIQYNYLDVNYQAGKRGLDCVAGKNAACVIMEPLRGGFLIRDIPAELQEMLRGVRPEWTLADWALRWLWAQKEVATVLSGMSTMEQVVENCRIAQSPADFGAKEEAALETVRRWFAERLKVNCTACGYCLPCPNGVAIPKMFTYYNEYHMDVDGSLKERAVNMYNGGVAEAERAAHCVSCGVCEERCPQGIKIGEEMPKVAELFAAKK